MKPRPLIFGEVLFDRFPDGAAVLGGAPLNVAWHLAGFGRDPALVSRVGSDTAGADALARMTAHGLDPAGVQRDPDRPTGVVQVGLVDGEPEYTIVPDAAWDAIAAEALPELDDPVALLYHGSLAARAAVSRDALLALAARTAAPRFIDVNLRRPWWSHESVLELLRGAAWVKLNEHELEELGLGDPRDAVERLELRMLVVTCGERGAHVQLPADQLTVAPGPTRSVVDSVGAGDAFTSVTLLGLLEGWELPVTLGRAQEFAEAVLGVRGALLHGDRYADWRQRWRLDAP